MRSNRRLEKRVSGYRQANSSEPQASMSTAPRGATTMAVAFMITRPMAALMPVAMDVSPCAPWKMLMPVMATNLPSRSWLWVSQSASRNAWKTR